MVFFYTRETGSTDGMLGGRMEDGGWRELRGGSPAVVSLQRRMAGLGREEEE